jgi:hypothetical protein
MVRASDGLSNPFLSKSLRQFIPRSSLERNAEFGHLGMQHSAATVASPMAL